MNRREFAKLGGVALAGTMLATPGLSLAAETAKTDPALALKYVAPELRPAAQSVLDMMASMPPFDAETIRQPPPEGAQIIAPRLPDIAVEELSVPGSNGEPDVTVFVINAGKKGSRPAILHTHGGGFILGSAESEVGRLQALAKDLDCVIVSVEYRLSPEVTYAQSIEDNYAGLTYLYRNAEKLGVDTTRIAVMGESAGGGHAALLALTAHDRAEVPICFQSLIYPMLDDRTGSTRQLPPYIGVIGWDARANKFGWESFLGCEPGGANVPIAAVPARREDLSGLPPAFIGVGGVDLFIDEDIEYARRLTDAGVPTELFVTPGAFHGFDQVAAGTSLADQFTKVKMNALRRAFGQPMVI
ncbi:alpha/beta hydrolase [Altericroceibacterium endophyticum]|uniref:Alpha/beta hydrolase fold domain-containing protein n=1 Tax=Altericroceibacterium endophyticum TaxID=1808508 RepID=A0A6I4T7H5_9SPHN|nr:alpha/beta hydrolase [Altericroceibacterium endophyticum]MXO66419.1 alpha/beta hydrolase fold domain-containing protein [Altericroceibacterium endophyticum]